eukprot:UN00276
MGKNFETEGLSKEFFLLQMFEQGSFSCCKLCRSSLWVN